MTLFTNDLKHIKLLQGWEKNALDQFHSKLMNRTRAFPCIPAVKGYAVNHFRYGFIDDPREDSSSKQLARILTEYTKNSRSFGSYTSLIVFLKTPKDIVHSLDVLQFEKLFWEKLNQLGRLDESNWPNHIPKNPCHSLWEFCFSGEQYFMYCATPSHKNRVSRSFPFFMFAITPRWVLEEFYTSSGAAKIKKEIRKRLEVYDTHPPHPNLNHYGEANNFEWKQYFLRDDDSLLEECPFKRE